MLLKVQSVAMSYFDFDDMIVLDDDSSAISQCTKPVYLLISFPLVYEVQ